jgi:two-component system, NtrC family, response regulator PilR
LTVSVKLQVLVVDDELSMRELLEIVLQNDGYEVETADDVEGACALLETTQYDVVLTDLCMGNDRDAGMRLLSWLEENAPGTPAIMMTAHGSVETAIEAMKRSAADYIMKPFKNDEIRILIERAINQRNLLRENIALRGEQAKQGNIDNMIGKSPAFQKAMKMIRRVAALPSTVAVHGESGAGKELVARALHNLSNRADKPFVAINCGGIPENLLESELFGHKKGSFTGATDDKEGLFVVANGGTIFLDEIGEMPLMLQVKLLRVLDNNTVTPVGSTTDIKVDVRLVSATNRDLEKMSEEGSFRSDLFYRLNVIPIQVPPLRERRDDIPLLCRHFVQQHAKNMSCECLEISTDAQTALNDYNWPGNVRELGNVMERALALCAESEIGLDDLPENIRNYTPEQGKEAVASASTVVPDEGMDMEQLIADIERDLIKQALEKGRYSQKKAASLLGLTPRSLRYRLQKYGLEGQ